MRILALLPELPRRALENALGPKRHLSVEKDARLAIRALRQHQCDAVVLDPAVLSADDFEQMLEVLARCTVPVLLYTSLTADAARRVVRLAELGAHELIIRGVDDAPQLVAGKLTTLLSPSAPALLLNRAASRLRAFPEPLQTASVALFGNGPMPRWVNDLTRTTGLGRRTIDRWMERTGINGAASLLDTARMARVWELVVINGESPRAVAHRLGYRRLRLLVTHTRRLVDSSPSELGSRLTLNAFADHLATALFGS